MLLVVPNTSSAAKLRPNRTAIPWRELSIEIHLLLESGTPILTSTVIGGLIPHAESRSRVHGKRKHAKSIRYTSIRGHTCLRVCPRTHPDGATDLAYAGDVIQP
eukprot:3299907-Pyramimonas_sp.AAC.3